MIDINNVNIRELKLTDLIADATERNDKEALAWLREQAMKKVPRKGNGDTTKEAYQPVNMFRVEYLTKFCGYKKKEAVKLTAEQKREQMLNSMFDEAFAKIQ